MFRTLAAALFALLITTPTRAATIEWSLNDVVPPLTTGITVTGFFDFNTAIPCCLPSDFPNYDLTLTSNGVTIFNFTPSNSFFQNIASDGFGVENNGATISNIDYLDLAVIQSAGNSPFDGAQGATLNLSSDISGIVFNSKFGGLVELPLEGQLVESAASPAPLPDALPLFATGLIALAGFSVWRKPGKVS